ncbi:MAG: hypothetical protein Q9N32_06530 [Gammaproteobacteria bacterium]|nr:hypothetical protein [Gammaproteobacteria bacterium]
MSSGGIGLTIQAYTIVNDGLGTITSQSLNTGAGKGVYLSSNTSNPNLGVVSSLSGDGHSLDGGDSGTGEPDEGLLFTFNQVVSLDFINFDSFNSTDDDFNLTIDGVSTLVDFGSLDTSPFVSHDDGQNDHFFFNSFIGTEFLIWAGL